MKKNVIKNKSFEFALEIIKIFKFLQSKNEFVLSKQILRSGTSIGAMIRESQHAESKADFIHKMAIAQKEANETEYWLELLFKSDYINDNTFSDMKLKIEEIKKIISSIIITTKARN
ncbi:MAG: TIGR02436 family protein [uncultured Campylobacterales bacterium]|uniref:TIGR02436 family protein n=1 Tax=uncultured Campylobacterales bacterium TaxID=352960 RepID=A0A6S6T8R8_9BACT|nr:MAG: TIGR02436 family protein [uncultured Campylobacterales bacterium]